METCTLSLPINKAVFTKTLTIPPNGYAGEMSQPHWIFTWNGGNGCFIFGDESVLYAMDRNQTLLWQLRARLAFSGYALDGKTICMVDGHVLLSYNADTLQTLFAGTPNAEAASAEIGPQLAMNLITRQRYSSSPSEGDRASIYDLSDPTDQASAETLMSVRRLRSWLQLLEEALDERRKTQILLVSLEGADASSDKFDLLAARDLNLAKFIDDIRWLLGADNRHKDRSCHGLFTSVQEKLNAMEAEAANLRFTAPVICRDRGANEECVFVMDATGGCRGLTASFVHTGIAFDTFSLDAPASMKMIPVEMDGDYPPTVAYLKVNHVQWFLSNNDGIIWPLPDMSWETVPSPEKWNELLALKRSRNPWARANLPNKALAFTVYNASRPGAKNLLFVSNDLQTDTSAVQLVASLVEFPAVDGTNDFAQPAPRLIGGTLSAQNGDVSGPILSPVGLLYEADTAFVYALTFSSSRPSQILEWVNSIGSAASEWQKILGTSTAQREKTREGVTAGQIRRPLQTWRTVDWHKVRMQTEVTTEDWPAAWQSARRDVTDPAWAASIAAARVAYTRSPLWNAWKEAGTQVLEGVLRNPPSQPYP